MQINAWKEYKLSKFQQSEIENLKQIIKQNQIIQLQQQQLNSLKNGKIPIPNANQFIIHETGNKYKNQVDYLPDIQQLYSFQQYHKQMKISNIKTKLKLDQNTLINNSKAKDQNSITKQIRYNHFKKLKTLYSKNHGSISSHNTNTSSNLFHNSHNQNKIQIDQISITNRDQIDQQCDPNLKLTISLQNPKRLSKTSSNMSPNNSNFKSQIGRNNFRNVNSDQNSLPKYLSNSDSNIINSISYLPPTSQSIVIPDDSISIHSISPALKLPSIDSQLTSTIYQLASAYREVEHQIINSKKLNSLHEFNGSSKTIENYIEKNHLKSDNKCQTPRISEISLLADGTSIKSSPPKSFQSNCKGLSHYDSLDRTSLTTAGSVNRDEVMDLLNWTNQIQQIEDEWDIS